MTLHFTIQLNGQPRVLETIDDPSMLDAVVVALGLHPGRVAVELNGEIVPRSMWLQTPVKTGDRLEIVNFVGGGLS
ncbi:MAG: sulfur carrier protein ThiS [Acidobacteriaceae bacterium]